LLAAKRAVNLLFMAVVVPEYKPFRPRSDLHGKYTPVYLIAVGGMSEIWACLHHRSGNLVAVKRLLPHSMVELAARKSGVYEEFALRTISHPNVLRFIEQGQDDGRLCFVTELIPGINFDHYLAHRSLSLEKFFDLAPQMLEGTAAIHAHSLVHGDLKPENMMLTQEADGRLLLKILDFGTASLITPRDMAKGKSIDPTDLLVTAEYVAPEILRGEPPSIASDLYSLGMSFYHCLAGRPAFEAAEPREVLRAQLYDEPPDLRSLREDLPAYLCSWVMRFLDKDPSKRPPSAAAAIKDLSAMRRQQPEVRKMARRTGTRRIPFKS
jgi:serine/threonine-protein kinase